VPKGRSPPREGSLDSARLSVAYPASAPAIADELRQAKNAMRS
jgi:hypothetical protein